MKQLVAFIRTTLLVIVAAAITVFVMQNLAPVEVTFITWTMSMPRALGVIASVAVGVPLGAAMARAWTARA